MSRNVTFRVHESCRQEIMPPCSFHVQWNLSTINGQIGDWPFVPCREVVPFSEVIIVSLLYHKINYYRGKYCACQEKL